MAVTLRGIAMGLGASFKEFDEDEYGDISELPPEKKHTSAEEFLGIISASNLNVGIIRGRSN